MNIKADVRVSTGKQFEYTSFFLEGTVEEIMKEEVSIRNAYDSGGGLPDDAMTDFVYKMVNKQQLDIEIWESMRQPQKVFINQLKKALARKPLK